jgi:tetratricopeptide (TPR) repeat protein
LQRILPAGLGERQGAKLRRNIVFKGVTSGCIFGEFVIDLRSVSCPNQSRRMEIVLTSASTSQHAPLWRKVLPVALAAMFAFACGCERSGPISGAQGENEANYQRAKKLGEQHDFEGAAEFYKRALAVNPEFASAHLELGLLCDDKLGDPIAAIYHYRQYLELRPDSDKRQLVTDFIERAKLSLAAKLPQSPIIDPSELTRLQNEKAAMLQENAMLRTRVAELEKAASVAAAKPMVSAESAPTSASATPVTPSAAPVVMASAPVTLPVEDAPVESTRGRMHIVQKGDTLYSLALRYYGARAGWERIYQANRSGLPSRDQLKVGQQLVIP